jgi:hypothetical protein
MADFPTQPEQKRVDRALSAHEGMNTRNAPWLLTDNELADSENMLVSKLGVITRRGGVQAFGGRTDAPGGLAPYVEPDGDQKFAAIWGNLLYSSQGDSAWDQIATGASLVSGLLHDIVAARINADLSFAVCSVEQNAEADRSKLLLYNIASDSYTQATLAPRCITAQQNRIFAAEEDSLFWSGIGLPASFTLASSLLVEPGLGGQITALYPTRDEAPRLVIFKDRMTLIFEPRWGSSSAYIPTAGDALDTINSRIRVLSPSIGCVATRSVVEVPGFEDGDVFFLAHDGVRALRRSATDSHSGPGQPITWKIPDTIARVNFSQIDKAAASFFDNAYHLALPMDGAATNTHVLRFDLENRAWTVHKIGCHDVREARLGSTSRFFLQSNRTGGDTSVTNASGDDLFQVYQLFTGDIDPGGNEIDWAFTTRGFTGENTLDRRKNWISAHWKVSSTATTFVGVSYKHDLKAVQPGYSGAIIGSEGSIVLGVDPLPWDIAPTSIRTWQANLADQNPGFVLQMVLHSITNASDFGKPSFYMTQVDSFIGPDFFESDV